MSVVETFYNTTFSVNRNITVTGQSTTSYQAVSSGNYGLLDPVQDRGQLYREDNMGKEYRLYCSQNVDIKIGDKVGDGTSEYGVQAVSDWLDQFGSDNYRSVVLVKDE